MKVVVLAGGYGTRLRRDIENDEAKTFKHLLEVPKSLLPVGEIPLLSHWMSIFNTCEIIHHVYIETNEIFYKQFEEWSKNWKDFVSIVNDGTNTNESRLGAVGSIAYATQHFRIMDDDILVLAGDTLFYDDFDLTAMIDQYFTLKATNHDCSLVTVYQCAEKDVAKHGILEVKEPEHRVTSFLEKPSPGVTSSRLACPCFYILSPQALNQVSAFLKENEDSPLQKKDATGNFLKYLYKRLPIFTYKISGRFDVGGLPSYITCLEYFEKNIRR